MAINKKLIHFKSKQKFNEELANGNILETSIVFILETTEIYTHGQLYDGSTFDPSDIEASIENIINNKADKTEIPTKISQLENDEGFITNDDIAGVATSGSYNDLTDKPTIPSAVTESTVSGWGFTKNTGTYSKPSSGIPKTDLASAVQTSLGKADTALQSYTEQYKGTITGVSANGTSVATSGVANIPAASTSKYGVTKLSSATNSTSTSLAATASAVKAAYDLANGKQDKLVSGTNIKTINGTSILGSGDITISEGSSDANVQAVDTGDVIDDVTVNYATKTYVDGLVGDINSILESIIGGSVSLITFIIDGTEYQAEEGMTWSEWVGSEYDTGYYTQQFMLMGTFVGTAGAFVVDNGVNVRNTSNIEPNGEYSLMVSN